MSLRDAVEEVAGLMEADVKDGSIPEGQCGADAMVKSYVRILRMALKASEGQDKPSPFADNIFAETIKAKQQMEQQQMGADLLRQTKKEEAQGTRMVEMEDSSGVPTYVPIAADMPIGYKTFVGGKVCQLCEGNILKVLEELT